MQVLNQTFHILFGVHVLHLETGGKGPWSSAVEISRVPIKHIWETLIELLLGSNKTNVVAGPAPTKWFGFAFFNG